MTQNSNILCAALAGCGRIGSFTTPQLRERVAPGWLPLNHAEAIQANPGLKLEAVGDVDAANAERAATTYGARAYTDIDNMLAEVRPEILAIATRTAPRRAIVMTALDNGVRGIHCEKPLATNLADCKTILSACAAKGVPMSYGTTRRYMDVFRIAHDRIAAGEIGELLEIETQLNQNRLLWTHPHSTDIVLFFAGDRTAVSATGRCVFADGAITGDVVNDDPVVEDAEILFSDGLKARFVNIPGNNIILKGSKGRFSILDDGRTLVLEKGGVAMPCPFTPAMSGTQRAFHELAGAVNGAGKLGITPDQIEMGLRLLLAVTRSAMDGCAPIKPEAVGDEFTVTGRIGEMYA